MIFISVGTQAFPLNRLLIQIDKLIESKKITEDIFAQTGHSDYLPKHYKFKTFLSKDEFDCKIEECSILITHSGVGTIMAGLRRSKPVIVFPRLSKFGEHVDDHQLEIAQSFSALNYILVCYENDNLADLIDEAQNHRFSIYHSHRDTVIETLRLFLNETQHQILKSSKS